jgi:DNA-directed RNA polymerase subunit RPC12/RpoP
MTTKFFHGQLNVEDIADILVTRFNRANLMARKSVNKGKAVVQIGSDDHARSGGDTALGVTLIQNEDGVSVTVGQQAWFGIAASLGFTAIAALRHPLNILGRLDDIAQDLENLQLDDEVWKVIEEVAKAVGASQALSDKLRSLMCEYCGVANSIGEPDCIACGAPLGNVQPTTCPHCGFVVFTNTTTCPNCNKKINRS